jgi:hypothetical protein
MNEIEQAISNIRYATKYETCGYACIVNRESAILAIEALEEIQSIRAYLEPLRNYNTHNEHLEKLKELVKN